MWFRQKSSPLAVPRLSLSICSWSFYFFDFLPFLSSCSCPSLPCGFAVVLFLIFMANHVEHETYQNGDFHNSFFGDKSIVCAWLCKKETALAASIEIRLVFVQVVARWSTRRVRCMCVAQIKRLCWVDVWHDNKKWSVSWRNCENDNKISAWLRFVEVGCGAWRRSLANCTINSLRFWQIRPSIWLQISLRCF